MKQITLLSLIIFFSIACIAQYPKYIIQFTDKNNSPYSIADPSKYLSAKAIDRRTKFNIPVDSTDLPVHSGYINRVLAKGNVQLLSRSRWLNAILIYCTDTATVNKIRSLSFVKSAQGIGNRASDTGMGKFKEAIEPFTGNRTVQKTNGANIYDYGDSYAQVHIHHGEYLHNKGFSGQGITIAILDAGFNRYDIITAFDSIRLNNQVMGVRDFVAFDSSVTEDDAHGRYCLSTMAANWPGRMVGTAPKANFWLLRTENVASEYPIEEFNWVVGAEFADSAGADMISSSLGYNLFNDASFNHTYNDFYKNTTMVSKGAAYACKKGMIVTNSAGNEGGSTWKYIIFPADADSVCTVGAVDVSGQIAGFSSYGYHGKIKPNIVSVGVNTVIAGISGPTTGSGTSFSNPNIAGLIACLWQAFPNDNNMTILNAVYQSADKFNNPNHRFGYGSPNMKTAYQILKHQQSMQLYGSNWLFVKTDTFTNMLNIKLIGRVDGNAVLQLKNERGIVQSAKNISTEQEEIYNPSFTALDDLPPGKYTLTYKDGSNTKTISLVKKGSVPQDWLQALPVPFTNRLTVYLKAPETCNAIIRLTDANGQTVESQNIHVKENTAYYISFEGIPALSKNVYFIQFIGSHQNKTIKIIKQ